MDQPSRKNTGQLQSPMYNELKTIVEFVEQKYILKVSYHLYYGLITVIFNFHLT
jgi:hypothetical protein